MVMLQNTTIRKDRRKGESMIQEITKDKGDNSRNPFGKRKRKRKMKM